LVTCVVGVLALVSIAGCGGGSSSSSTTTSTISKAELVKRGDAICAEAKAAQAKLPAPPPIDPATATADDLAKVESYVKSGSTIFTDEIAKLRALGVPSNERATWEKALTTLTKGSEAQAAMATAAGDGDVAGFKTALAQVTATALPAQHALKSLGFKVCGH
jgi:hypothetical protein